MLDSLVRGLQQFRLRWAVGAAIRKRRFGGVGVGFRQVGSDGAGMGATSRSAGQAVGIDVVTAFVAGGRASPARPSRSRSRSMSGSGDARGELREEKHRQQARRAEGTRKKTRAVEEGGGAKVCGAHAHAINAAFCGFDEWAPSPGLGVDFYVYRFCPAASAPPHLPRCPPSTPTSASTSTSAALERHRRGHGSSLRFLRTGPTSQIWRRVVLYLHIWPRVPHLPPSPPSAFTALVGSTNASAIAIDADAFCALEETKREHEKAHERKE
ncbi:hypothetical protein B0H16DRAFT_1473242 [Mycena metata]|uniref:Uncharacterized protein n=1 Tax=Mycena metata TaxID=1033252 RepID=A0AAD7HLR6_9AGAR|nr:hypothetical protein B0H16DRAFT_1473242 [Mycena metata]